MKKVHILSIILFTACFVNAATQQPTRYIIHRESLDLGAKNKRKRMEIHYERGSFFVVEAERSYQVSDALIGKKLKKMSAKSLRKFISGGGKIEIRRRPNGLFRIRVAGGLSDRARRILKFLGAVGGGALSIVAINFLAFVYEMKLYHEREKLRDAGHERTRREVVVKEVTKKFAQQGKRFRRRVAFETEKSDAEIKRWAKESDYPVSDSEEESRYGDVAF